jgi:hypothetical protein
VTDPADEPQPMAVAMVWVSRIFAISAEMFVPGLLGDWLGKRWGFPNLALVGFALGISMGLTHLILMTKAESRATSKQKKSDRRSEK